MTMRELLNFNRPFHVPVLRGESPIRRLQEEMNGLFDNFFGETSWPSRLWHSQPSFAVSPPVDITENDKSFTITAEVPGMEQSDIQVSCAEGYVTIKGEKQEEEKEEKPGYFRQERSYGQFQRVIALPESANLDKAEATVSKGVLTVTVPKKAGAQSKERKIEVKQAA